MSVAKAKTTNFNTNKPAKAGHNLSAEQLRSLVNRYENLEEEKKSIAEEVRDLMHEVKGQGFDVKIFRAMVKLKQIETSEREAYFDTLDTYARALGFSILDLERPEEE